MREQVGVVVHQFGVLVSFMEYIKGTEVMRMVTIVQHFKM